MGSTAMAKLEKAKRLDQTADGLKKRDPESAEKLHTLAKSERRKAIRQMTIKRKRPTGGGRKSSRVGPTIREILG